MRESTCSSYVLLIVDRRNITGRHPTGNAKGSVSECLSTTGTSLLRLPCPAVLGAADVACGQVDRAAGRYPSTPVVGPNLAPSPVISHAQRKLRGQSW